MITFEYPYLVFLIFLPFIIRYLLPTVKGLYGDALKVPFVQDFTNIENKIAIIAAAIAKTPIKDIKITCLPVKFIKISVP